jgi:fatty-acid desaturase
LGLWSPSQKQSKTETELIPHGLKFLKPNQHKSFWFRLVNWVHFDSVKHKCYDINNSQRIELSDTCDMTI